MGKWASGRKKGSAAFLGSVTAMSGTDFVVSLLTATSFTMTRTPALVAPADRWIVQVVDTALGSIAFTTFNVGPGLAVTGLTTGRTYSVYAAWYSTAVGARISDWSTKQTVVTP